MRLHGSRMRDPARVFQLSTAPVSHEWKQKGRLSPRGILRSSTPYDPTTERSGWPGSRTPRSRQGGALWGSSTSPLAVARHRSRKVLADGFGRHQDAVFLRRKARLEPFGIRRFFTEQWGA